MEKEKMKNTKPSINAKDFMDYVENVLRAECRSHPRKQEKIINGLWTEKTKCTVRNYHTYDGIQGARIMHYDVVDAFYEMLAMMKENDLTLEDLNYEKSPPELPYPSFMFSISTKEHEYEYYPILLCGTYNSKADEYIQIKNSFARLRAFCCQSKDNL